MPIIILGLIVVLGACLLLYYQLGPKVTLRLKKSLGLFGGAEDGPGAAGGSEAKEGQVAGAEGQSKASGDDKVLYIFGDGGREERPLRGDGGQSGDDGSSGRGEDA